MTMMTTAEVAQALGMSRRAVNDAIGRKALPATRQGRDWMVDPEHVVAYGANRRGGAGRPPAPGSRRLNVSGLDPEVGAAIRRHARHLGLTLPAYLTALETLRREVTVSANKGSVEAQERLRLLGLWSDVEPGWEAFVERYGQALGAYQAESR